MMFSFGLKKQIESARWASISMAAIALTALLSSGCESLNHCSTESCCDTLFSGWRDHVWAKRAYYQAYPSCGHAHPSHFRRGFIDGYSAVCGGGDAYMPAVPPQDYWGYSYQSADGSQMVDAWFSGYPEGVKAATHDGAGKYREVQVSSMLNSALQPATDVWAPYATEESGSQPPVLSGQDMAMPPLPEQQSPPPIPENGTPIGMVPLDAKSSSISSEGSPPSNTPMTAQRRIFSWGRIR